MEFIKLFCLVLCYNFVLCQFENTCQTLDGATGSCILPTNCDPYLEVVSRAKNEAESIFVPAKSHCALPKVCCPTTGIHPVPPTPDPAIDIDEKIGIGSRNDLARNNFAEDFATAFPEPPLCGMSNASLGRVVGGVDANLGDFPWMAALGYKNSTGTRYSWWCGGSLITSQHVLTAAHCIYTFEDTLHLVRLGELDLSKDDDGASPVDVVIKTKIKHEQFNYNSLENDVGVLVLQEIVQFTDLISPICMPTENMRSENYVNYNPIVAGWGALGYQGQYPTRLQMVQVPVRKNDVCVKAFKVFVKQVIDERVLCAGYKNGGKDACFGDSGGPLMLPLMNDAVKKSLFYQIGIVSYGNKCADADFPGIYSRTTYFLPWIRKTVLGS